MMKLPAHLMLIHSTPRCYACRCRNLGEQGQFWTYTIAIKIMIEKIVKHGYNMHIIVKLAINFRPFFYHLGGIISAMNTHKRMHQMAHLNQHQISDNSCKAIIIDTILESVAPLTQADLSGEIASTFHILVTAERLNSIINTLSSEGIIFFDTSNHINIVSSMETKYRQTRLQETNLKQKATQIWLNNLEESRELSAELKTDLTTALPIFLRSLFVRHGVTSYELLTTRKSNNSFDVKQIAKIVAEQFATERQNEIEILLPSIFQSQHEPNVLEYLQHSIEKAVGYISEVISDENLAHITESLKSLTLYLDTNTLYRLLNLQGEARHDAIRETLKFCIANGVKLKISAATKKELSARLKFDAKVLIQYPTRTNLASAGYNYRTSDNYVSTYWNQARKTNISVDDYIAYYQNFDLLLRAENIEVEEIEVDDNALIDHARCIYEKLSLRDIAHEKSEPGLWHDAYNLAYVQKMQKADGKTAIDTGCLFLSTDQALTSLQCEDHELKELPPIVISPSQLLQIFSFSKPDSGYEETFIKFFASSSLGRSFEYDNNHIQEILSRISHYQGVSPEVAEKILARTLLNSRYWSADSEAEKEEIIYNSISDELLNELDLTKSQLTALVTENTQLSDTNSKLSAEHQAALDVIAENQEQFSLEKMKLQAQADEINARLEQESSARILAEKGMREATEYGQAQELLYLEKKWHSWKRNHLCMFWGSIILSVVIIVLSILLATCTNEPGWYGILGALTLPLAFLPFGHKVFSPGIELDIKEKYLADYKQELQKIC